jgi:hypothetical protein
MLENLSLKSCTLFEDLSSCTISLHILNHASTVPNSDVHTTAMLVLSNAVNQKEQT